MTQQQQQFDLTVEGVGPFKKPTTIGAIRPGVNLLRAPNGWGKTCLLRTLALFARARLKAGDLVINDESTGSVATARFGPAEIRAKVGRVPNRSGAENLPPIEGLPDAIGQLEHGEHRKGDDARFRSRLVALLAWAHVEADQKLVRSLVDASTVPVELGSALAETDLLKATEKLRSSIHAWRRKKETERDEIERRIAALEGKASATLEEAGISQEELAGAGTEEGCRESHAAARLALAEIRQQRAAYVAEQERREKVRASLGEPPDVEAAENRALEAGAAASAALARVEQLRKELADEQAKLERANAEASAARREYSQAQHRADRHAEASALLEEELTGPSEEDVAAAARGEAETRQQLHRAQTALRLERVHAARATEFDSLERVNDQIADAEREAAAVWTRLAERVNQHLEGSRIRVAAVAQELEVQIDEEWRRLGGGRVSEGQWAAACYDLLVERLDGPRVIVIEGSTSVDRSLLADLGDAAARRGGCLVLETQEVPEGQEWTIEHFGRREEAAA